MVVFVIISYDLDFSNNVIKYFESLNPRNQHRLTFIPVGIEKNLREHEIINDITKKIQEFRNVDNVIIFTDQGAPYKLGKRIELKDKKIKVHLAKGSLIENGYLAYLLLNTKSPEELVDNLLNDRLDKDSE